MATLEERVAYLEGQVSEHSVAAQICDRVCWIWNRRRPVPRRFCTRSHVL